MQIFLRSAWHVIFGSIVYVAFLMILEALFEGIIDYSPLGHVGVQGYLFLAGCAFFVGYILAHLSEWRDLEAGAIGFGIIGSIILYHIATGDISEIRFQLTLIVLCATCIPMYFGSWIKHKQIATPVREAS